MRIILEQRSKVRQKRTILNVQNVFRVLRMMMLYYGYAVMFVIPDMTSSALILNQKRLFQNFITVKGVNNVHFLLISCCLIIHFLSHKCHNFYIVFRYFFCFV